METNDMKSYSCSDESGSSIQRYIENPEFAPICYQKMHIGTVLTKPSKNHFLCSNQEFRTSAESGIQDQSRKLSSLLLPNTTAFYQGT